MTEADIAATRTDALLAQWPTAGEVCVCNDCDLLFRSGPVCPHCQSRSVQSVRHVLAGTEGHPWKWMQKEVIQHGEETERQEADAEAR